MFELEMFPASDGDALVLRWGDIENPKRMLIDAGRDSCWSSIKQMAEALPEDQRTFELLVVSHIDADHIAGVLKMLRDPARPISFKEVWFNAYHHLVGGGWETFGPAQGEAVSDLLEGSPQTWNSSFDGKAVVIEGDGSPTTVNLGDLELTLLSPSWPKLQRLANEWKTWLRLEGLDRGQMPDNSSLPSKIVPNGFEAFGPLPDVRALATAPVIDDDGAPNGSSIAFAASYERRRVLLCADAHPDLLASSLAKLTPAERRFDLVKLSHHGSKGNFSRALADSLDCQRFAISTNGSRHRHPDPESVSRILMWKSGKKQLYFNYRHQEAAVWDSAHLKALFDYDCEYAPDNSMGRLRISI